MKNPFRDHEDPKRNRQAKSETRALKYMRRVLAKCLPPEPTDQGHAAWAC